MELCRLSHDNFGQTGGKSLTRYEEHLRPSRTNNSKSVLSHHLLDNSYAMGATENMEKMLQISKAGQFLNILERFYIFRGSKIEVKRQIYSKS